LITVTDNTAASRLEVQAGDALLGYAEYIRTPELMVVTHTEVDDAHAGRGVGSLLANEGMTRARSDRLRVVTLCPFIAGWLRRHPEHLELEYRSHSKVAD
jgi:predicted GNAT family acetyltransferase